MEPIRDCSQARPLVPAYQDGELPETQAAPLRRHLMACQSCREVAKSETALKRWFAAQPAVEVPAGFAANVARRAFAGAMPEETAAELTPFRAPGAGLGAALPPAEGNLLQFVLRLTVAAAVVLIALSFALRRESLPKSSDLDARTISDTIDYLQALEAADAEAKAKALSAQSDAAPDGLQLQPATSGGGERP